MLRNSFFTLGKKAVTEVKENDVGIRQLQEGNRKKIVTLGVAILVRVASYSEPVM